MKEYKKAQKEHEEMIKVFHENKGKNPFIIENKKDYENMEKARQKARKLLLEMEGEII